MNKPLALTLALLLIGPKPCLADTFLLKSGQQVTGKLVEKKEDKYIVQVRGSEERVELAVSQVSIADFDPNSEASPKGTLSLLTGPEAGGKEEKETGSNVVFVSDSSIPLLAKSGILKDAHDTVELSNQRTAQTVEVINQMKDAAEAAN